MQQLLHVIQCASEAGRRELELMVNDITSKLAVLCQTSTIGDCGLEGFHIHCLCMGDNTEHLYLTVYLILTLCTLYYKNKKTLKM